MTTRDKDQSERPPARRRTPRERRKERLESRLLEALASPVLNGGFDTLLSKVNKIEETQGTLVSKVNDVHEAIYNPDDGLFARIKNTETEREKDIIELQAWRESVNKDLLLDAEDDKELKGKLNAHELALVELKQFRSRAGAVTKWLMVALGGGGISLLFQWLSTFIG